ncbi:MAG: hypothetical protein ACYS83_11370 [Planctomycetota bacterium]
MKKIIMFVMVLAIATPAMALIWEPHSQGFAGCPGSGQVLWEFTEPGCLPTSDVADPPYLFDPDIPDPVFGTSYTDGGPVEGWTWSDGVYTANGEDGLNQPIPDRGGKQYMRMYFEVVHTMVESADPSFMGFAMELWDREDWEGCPTGAALIGDYEGIYFPPPTDTFDLGGGWHQSYWVFDFSTDGSVGTEIFPDLHDATHTTALFGMTDLGDVYPFDLEEVYINYIWYNNADGSDIPTVPCVCLTCPETRLIIDSNDIPVYEPQDTGGPPPQGPTDGQLQVNLAWKPGEDLGYPPFTCTVVVDPDPNVEHVGSADFSFTKPVPPDPNGNVTLYFTEANWDVYQNVHVEATEDLLKEGNESNNVKFTITIDIDDPNFGSDPCDPVTQTKAVIVMDNDIPYISVLPSGHLWRVLTENSPGVQRCVNVTLSHEPTHDVEVRAAIQSEYDLLFDTVIMDPNFEEWTDPNHLLFTDINYNSPQQICLTVVDDDELAEAWLEWVPGQIILWGLSDDPRYEAVSDDGDGELEYTVVNFNVQDNDCGSVGYSPYDVNEDCYNDLSEAASLYNEWLSCTYKDGRSGTGVAEFKDCDAAWNF